MLVIFVMGWLNPLTCIHSIFQFSAIRIGIFSFVIFRIITGKVILGNHLNCLHFVCCIPQKICANTLLQYSTRDYQFMLYDMSRLISKLSMTFWQCDVIIPFLSCCYHHFVGFVSACQYAFLLFWINCHLQSTQEEKVKWMGKCVFVLNYL